MTAEERMVYCTNCKHYRVISDQCTHPDNLCVRDTYLRAENAYDATPSEVNKFNDCEWFAPQWWGRRIVIEDAISGWWSRLFTKRSK